MSSIACDKNINNHYTIPQFFGVIGMAEVPKDILSNSLANEAKKIDNIQEMFQIIINQDFILNGNIQSINDETGKYFVYENDFKGIVTYGSTLQKLFKNIKEAIHLAELND